MLGFQNITAMFFIVYSCWCQFEARNKQSTSLLTLICFLFFFLKVHPKHATFTCKKLFQSTIFSNKDQLAPTCSCLNLRIASSALIYLITKGLSCQECSTLTHLNESRTYSCTSTVSSTTWHTNTPFHINYFKYLQVIQAILYLIFVHNCNSTKFSIICILSITELVLVHVHCVVQRGSTLLQQKYHQTFVSTLFLH